MDLLTLEKLYEERGLYNYKLRTIDDLCYIHNIKLNQIKGYGRLIKKNKILFNNFIIRYFNNHNLDSRNIIPLEIYLTFTERYYFNSFKGLQPYRTITYTLKSTNSKQIFEDTYHTDNKNVPYFLKTIDSSIKFKCIVNYGRMLLTI